MIQKLSQTVKKIRVSKREILLQIFTVFILPVLILQAGFVPISARMPILVGTVSLFALLLFKERWTFPMVHFERSSLKKYFFPYLIFTLVGVVLISAFSEKIGHEEVARWWNNQHFLYLFFVVSAFQEIAYRGYLIPALQKLTKNSVLTIFFNALIFTYMHIIFLNPGISLPLAFIGGIGFATMYIRYPNLILIILSHSVLNFVAVLFGFFTVK